MKKHLLSLNIFCLFLLFYGTQNVTASIISQPRDVTVCAGSTTVGFSVKTDVISTYQWQVLNGKLWTNLVDQKDPTVGVTIAGATTSSITFGFSKYNPLTTAFSGTAVRCVVTFKLTPAYSTSAVTTVVSAPSITSQPVGLDVVENQPASFSIAASGAGLTYQWQISQDGGASYYDILYATSSAYSLKYVTVKDAGLYRCMVTNGICTARYSSGAALNVYPVMTIDKHPGKASGCEKGTAKFAVYATNATAYQWEVLYPKTEIWEPLKNGNESVYVTEPLLTNWDGAQFHCVVSGGAGQTLTSYAGILYVYSYVSIYSHPSGASKITGESVTFNVSASGSVLSYQWQFKNVNISGATSSSYTIGSLQVTDAGDYRCVVNGKCNSVTSNSASLSVSAPVYANGWIKQTTATGLNITTVSPITDLKAWALTSDPNKLLKTTDGGANWDEVSTDYSYGYWHSLYFTSDLIGMVGGQNGISRTTDGGTTWLYVDLKTQFGLGAPEYFYIENFHFRDASNGWAVGTNGIVIKTTDGGANWTKRSYKTDNVSTRITDVGIYSIFFVDANIGYLGGQNGKLFKTIDAGVNWTELVSGSTTYTINDISFLTATKGFYTAGYGGLFATTNGTSWTQVKSEYVNSIDFVDSNNGWAAGQAYIGGSYKGRIIKTFDGGQTWVTQKIDNLYQLNEIRMYNANNGWVVGNGGEIYVTGKGGCYDPVVNLYADQTLCANQSYTLRADTFVNNYNSRYLWSNSSTAGNITVNSTDTYSVTITNECGKTASDNALITFLDLPLANAGLDVSICEGQSAQLLATGGTDYSWNNAAYLDNNVIANPVATPPTGQATTFTVTVTDANGCNNTDAVLVTVNALPTSDFTAPDYVCGTANGSFTYSGSASGKSFAWDFSGGTIASGSNAGPIQVNWSELGDKLVSLTTTANNCSSVPTLKIVNVREKPTSVFDAPASTCGASSAVLLYTGSAPTEALYSWGIDGGTITSGSGQGPVQVSWATPGTKALSLSVTQNECISDVSNHDLIVGYPYEGEEICLITVDIETGKNMIVWERTKNVGIKSYKVYRESSTANEYTVLDTISADSLSVYVDLGSSPETKAQKYYITSVDTCGNESSPSEWHKPMLLTSSIGTSQSTVNLNWSEYSKESGMLGFVKYLIYRSTSSNVLTLLDSIPSGSSIFVDDTAPKGIDLFYRIAGVKSSDCKPLGSGKKTSSGPFLHSLSNLEDNRLQSTGISNVLADALQLTVYPSPFTDLSTISYSLQKPSKMKVEIYNVVGEKIGVILEENQSAGVHKLEMKAEDVNYISGLYYLRIMVDEAVIIRKTMLTR